MNLYRVTDVYAEPGQGSADVPRSWHGDLAGVREALRALPVGVRPAALVELVDYPTAKAAALAHLRGEPLQVLRSWRATARAGLRDTQAPATIRAPRTRRAPPADQAPKLAPWDLPPRTRRTR